MYVLFLADHNLVVSKELEELIEMYRIEANLQREDSDASLGSDTGLKVTRQTFVKIWSSQRFVESKHKSVNLPKK